MVNAARNRITSYNVCYTKLLRTDLIWEVYREFSAGDELGIDFEEKAFHDILKALCVKYDFTYPEGKLIDLSKAVKALVSEQAAYPDWNKREDIKSALKVGLILLLDEFDYPPVERDEVYQDIFEQAENFKKYSKWFTPCIIGGNRN